MNKITIKCINSCGLGQGLTEGRVYMVPVDKWDKAEGSDIICVYKRRDDIHGINVLKSRFERVGNVEPQEQELSNLWDFLEEELKDSPVERQAMKQLIFTFIFSGEVLECCKKLKLSLVQVSKIVHGFDKWTGAEDEEE